jgi:hypothetical protein
MLAICDGDTSAVGFEAIAKPYKLNGLKIVDSPYWHPKADANDYAPFILNSF